MTAPTPRFLEAWPSDPWFHQSPVLYTNNPCRLWSLGCVFLQIYLHPGHLHVFFPSTSPPSHAPNTKANVGTFQNPALAGVALTTHCNANKQPHRNLWPPWLLLEKEEFIGYTCRGQKSNSEKELQAHPFRRWARKTNTLIMYNH